MASGNLKRQGFYNGLTEKKGGVGVSADTAFYIDIEIEK